MKFRFLIVFALLVAFIAGCGGNGERGSSGGDANAPENYMSSLKAAVLTRDIDTIRNRISNEYLDDCDNKEILVNAIMDVLAVGGTVDFQIMPVTNKNVGNNTATFNSGFELKSTNGETTRTLREEGSMKIRLENNTTWRLYGNQDCRL